MHKQFVSKMDNNLDQYATSILGCAGIAGYGTVYKSVKIQPGNSVAVFGVGGLGVLAVNAAKNLKADPIIAIDVDNKKLEFSRNKKIVIYFPMPTSLMDFPSDLDVFPKILFFSPSSASSLQAIQSSAVGRAVSLSIDISASHSSQSP